MKHKRNGERTGLGTREIDQDFRERIKNDRVFSCEKHFLPEDIAICKL